MRFARLDRAASCALAVALTLVGSATAAAQDIVPQVTAIDGRSTVALTDLATTMAQPISFSECEDSEISFRFTMVDTTRPNLRFFSGTGCDDPAIRNDTTNASCTDLELQFATEARSQVDVTVGVDELFDCSGSSGVQNIWVLAVDNETSTVTGAGQKVTFPIAFDFVGPAAPGSLTAGGGETAATLTWQGASDLSEYEVYFVPGGCTGGEPTTTIDPATTEPYTTIEGSNSSYRLVFPDSAPIGTQSAIALRAIDQTGNPSELSAVVCVNRIEVTSWWDAHCGGGGGSTDACGGMEGCAVAPGRRAGGWIVGLALLAAALVLVRARRSR